MEGNQITTPPENIQPVTRAYLKSLTTDDLIKMADNLGVDVPFDLDRIFIIEEILDIIREEEERSSLSPEIEMVDSGINESVPLPRQYNITFIKVLVRDPLWAFVLWEIKSQDKEQLEKSQDFSGYYLKVSPVGGSTAGSSQPRTSGRDFHPNKADNVSRSILDAEGVFTVPVGTEDNAWYLGFNPSPVTGKDTLKNNKDNGLQYKVELCAVLKDTELVLVTSNFFKLPRLYELPSSLEDNEFTRNPLCRLSGYGEFHILRNSERLFRIKRGAPDSSYE